MKKKNKNPLPYWNICEFCAHEKGGKLPNNGAGITVTRGKCKYCDTDGLMLIPIDDFNWPKLNRRAVFD